MVDSVKPYDDASRSVGLCIVKRFLFYNNQPGAVVFINEHCHIRVI